MRRFCQGDAKAFEALVGRHRSAVHAFLVRSLGDRSRAEDMTQEAWLRVIAAAPRWEEKARFRTWLFTVARNLAVDDSRRRSFRGKTVPLDGTGDGGEGAAVVLGGDDPPPDHLAEGALLRPRLEAAIASLPPEQREVFLLREFADESFSQIAAITGAPEPTVKSRMRYALESLRRRLAEMGVAPTASGEGGRAP